MADPISAQENKATARDLTGLALRFLVANRQRVLRVAAIPLVLMVLLQAGGGFAEADQGGSLWTWLIPATLITALFAVAVTRMIVTPPESARSLVGFARAAIRFGLVELLFVLALVMVGYGILVGLSLFLAPGAAVNIAMVLVLLLIVVVSTPYLFLFLAAAAVGWPGGTRAHADLAWRLGRRGGRPLRIAVFTSLLTYGAIILAVQGLLAPEDPGGVAAWIMAIFEEALSLAFEGYMSALAAYFFLWRLESSSAMVGPIQP